MPNKTLASVAQEQSPLIFRFGEVEVDYDESIDQKLAGIADPRRIGWRTDRATDQSFRDTRTGKKRYKVFAVRFGQQMHQSQVEAWCEYDNQILATPKEGIDLAKAFPRPKLDDAMPLLMPGQLVAHPEGGWYALYFDRDNVKRNLDSVWLSPSEQWDKNWFHLVLQEIPPLA